MGCLTTTTSQQAHYTVNELQPNGDGGSGEGWLHIDDEDVSAVRHKDVFKSHDNERGGDRCAYILYTLSI
jgi:hypothetical protein